jgi:hypothetical protein
MKHRDIWAKGCEFLPAATRRLAELRFADIAKWPEYPSQPDVDLGAPQELSSVQFTVMKDTQPDGTIRVAIQMYRHRFLGCGSMHADGFFISPEGAVRWFTEEDTWEVT